MRRVLAVGVIALVSCALAACAKAPPAPVVVPPPPPPVSNVPLAAAYVPTPPAPPTPTDGPPIPEKRPIDPSFKVDGAGLIYGISSRDVSLSLDGGYVVVVDRATGCATEGYHAPKNLETLSKSKDPKTTESEMAKPEVLAAIREVVGVGRRTSAPEARFILEMVWSPDGRYIFLESADILYKSSDGGRTFAAADDHFADRLHISGDGKYLVYQRCDTVDCPSCKRNYQPGCAAGRRWVSVPIDGSRGPLVLANPHAYPIEMRPDGKAVFYESAGTSVCASTYDLAQAVPAATTCITLPPKATGNWPSRVWQSVSPTGKYGIVKWEEGRPGLTYVVSLVEMASSKIVKTVLDMDGMVDDGGNMVMRAVSEGGGDHSYYYPLKGERRLLGNHSVLAWHDETAIMPVWKVATLGVRKCDLVKMVKTPR